MNPLLKKEIRLLLPAWCVALLLAAVPPWLFDYTDTVVAACVPAAIGAILLAVTPFGREFALGTAASMLVQPTPRRRILRTKLLLLAIAMLSALAVFWHSYVARVEWIMADASWWCHALPKWQLTMRMEDARSQYWPVLWMSSVAAAVIFAGGLWTTLVLRQMVAAFWVTILVPGFLLGLAGWPGTHLNKDAGVILSLGALLLYSLAGFIWSWKLFQTAQDTPLSWGNRTLPSLTEWTRRRKNGQQATPRHPLACLVRQEVSLHQTSLVAAGVLLILNLLAIAALASGLVDRHSEIASVLETRAFIWMLLPVFLGATAIAEERRSGTLQSLLCLPVSRLKLYTVKFSVTLSLAVILGAGGVLLTEVIGHPFGVAGFTEGADLTWKPVFWLVFGSCGVAFLGLYASSLAHSTLQSVGITVLLVLVGLVSVDFIANGDFRAFQATAWIPISMWVSAVAAITWLSYRNFGCVQSNLKQALRNVVVLLVTLAGVASLSAAIYHRAWEVVLPMEPDHGPARIGGTGRPDIQGVWRARKLVVLLPDGRLWISDGDQSDAHGAIQRHGSFLDGSTWTAIASSVHECVGIRSDGTLWSLFRAASIDGQWRLVEEKPRRIGTDSDWKTIAARGGNVLALKGDGTLWGWGSNDAGQLLNGTNAITDGPVQITDDSDWTAVYERYGSTVAVKRDGTTWQWGKVQTRKATTRYEVESYRQPTRWDVDLTNLKEFHGDSPGDLLLYDNGHVFAVGQYRYGGLFAPNMAIGYTDQPIQVGGTTPWKSLASFNIWADLLALSKAGELVRIGWAGDNSARILHPSRHNDWIAVGEYAASYVALAADGTLTYWYAWNDDGALAASRRPTAHTTLFDDEE